MTDSLIKQLHSSPWQFAIAVTGGGTFAVSDLLTVPGASKTVLEAVVPYSEKSLVDFLRHKPEQFCSERTARRLAMAAYLRARDCAVDANSTKLAGIGCTASLASDRPKRGDHRFHWAIQTLEVTICGSETLEKGGRTRAEEERYVADALLRELFHAFGMTSSDNIPRRQITADPELRELVFGSRKTLAIQGNTSKPKFLFPGSFDPIHEAHRRMIGIVQEKYSTEVALEITVHNVDKPPIDYIDIGERLRQIGTDQTVWLSQLPTFDLKSTYFDHATFIVGVDTLKRIADSRYYRSGFDIAMEKIHKNGCVFLCFARKNGNIVESLNDLSLPDSLLDICDEIPADVFCMDLSSTQLRTIKYSEATVGLLPANDTPNLG